MIVIYDRLGRVLVLVDDIVALYSVGGAPSTHCETKRADEIIGIRGDKGAKGVRGDRKTKGARGARRTMEVEENGGFILPSSSSDR